MGDQVTCGDTIIYENDDIHRGTLLNLMFHHVMKCSCGICYTSHGTFTMIDGILFERVDY